jgi:arylsulfatase A-like enzyme
MRSEGGIATPFIAHWSAEIQARGELRHEPGHIVDLMPTLIELAGAAYPTERHGTPLTPHGRHEPNTSAGFSKTQAPV